MDEEETGVIRLYFPGTSIIAFYENRRPIRSSSEIKGEKDASKRKEEVKGLLAELGIENCHGQYPNQMSGGQKQRAAIARAFIGNPQLILADEPTASLDPERGQEIAQLIQREVKSKHKSAIMVTHDRSVLEYVDTVYEMKKGKLVRL